MTSHERNQNKWREFCFDLIVAAKDDILEDPYQEMIEQGLRQLNWSKANGEICPKERLQIGNRKQLEPDITLKINDRSVFVIEVKRPSNKLNNDNILQLVSYMRQRQVPYGLYIGDRIALFYDDSIHQPTEVWGVKLDSDADEGWRFVDFFARGSFSAERLETFCKERMNEIHTSMGLRDIAGKLAENEGDAILKEIVEHYLVGMKQYDRGLITRFLNQYKFSAQLICKEEESNEEIAKENEIGQQSYYVLVKQARSKNGSNGRDNTKYSIDGGTNYFGKNRIVREIIIRYLELHPKMTYRQLEQIFPDEMQGSYGVVRSLDELHEMEHDRKDLETRYLMKEDELLKTADGILFAVCNQWGAYNIPNIFRVMEKWGWNVIKDKE